MITKKDAKDYYNQMLATEKKMEVFYSNLITKIKDRALIEQFSEMVTDEKEHGKVVQELMDLLDVYWKD